MPSTNKTPFLGLSNFEGTDKLISADYNRDMDKLDDFAEQTNTALDSLKEKKANATAQGVESWEQLTKCLSGYYLIMDSVVGMPQGQSYYKCDLWSDGRETSGTYSRAFDVTYIGSNDVKLQTRWTKNIVNGFDCGWVPTATATPPQEYALPLAVGYIATIGRKCGYSKAQDNLVLVNVAVGHTSGSVPIGDQICATLPAGYRPAEYVGDDTSGIFVDINGTVSYHQPTQIDKILRTIAFYAA